MTLVAGMTVSTALGVSADEGAASAARATAAADKAPVTRPRQIYPRSVYNVDAIGIIIGGASEDAKAKVGRLPIRD